MTNHTFRSILLLFVVGMALSACTRVEPGWVGIKVNEWGDQRGVEDFPIQTGKVTYNLWTETVYKFPTFLQNVVWTADENEGSKEDESITFNSIEGAVINADIAMSYSINGDMVPAIFVEFRKDIDHITDVYVRSQVRDAFSRHASMMKATDIFGSKKQELLTLVKDDLNENLGPRGFTFDMVSFVGGLRVEEKVQESIDAVLRAAQRAIEAENKIRQSEAEAQQMIAAARGDSASAVIRATGEAEANRLLSQSLTNDVVSYKAMLRWDGVMPQVTGSGGIPLIQLPAGGN